MKLFFLTLMCMLFFALNSLLCRMAMLHYGMDPLLFTSIRTLTASGILMILVLKKKRSIPRIAEKLSHQSSWFSAAFLFIYMLFFSLSLAGTPSASATLILNMAVQAAMVGWGIMHGIRLAASQKTGFAIAILGLVLLLSSNLTVPSLKHAGFMICSGLSWGAYCLCGRSVSSAVMATAGNFARCLPLGLLTLAAGLWNSVLPQASALWCAAAAGILATGLGYILWYSILPQYDLISSSIIQLSIPVVTAILAVPLLDEQITFRLILCSIFILGGICLAIGQKTSPNSHS
ncbi:MAG: DMT family transporter [Mailhella sp.]